MILRLAYVKYSSKNVKILYFPFDSNNYADCNVSEKFFLCNPSDTFISETLGSVCYSTNFTNDVLLDASKCILLSSYFVVNTDDGSNTRYDTDQILSQLYLYTDVSFDELFLTIYKDWSAYKLKVKLHYSGFTSPYLLPYVNRSILESELSYVKKALPSFSDFFSYYEDIYNSSSKKIKTYSLSITPSLLSYIVTLPIVNIIYSRNFISYLAYILSDITTAYHVAVTIEQFTTNQPLVVYDMSSGLVTSVKSLTTNNLYVVISASEVSLCCAYSYDPLDKEKYKIFKQELKLFDQLSS